MTPMILLTLGISALVLVIAAAYLKKGKRMPTDYYSLFIIGVVWLFLGMASRLLSFIILGLAFSAIGLANKSKWEKNKIAWSELGKEEKRRKIVLIMAHCTAGGVIAAIIVFLLAGK
jgi:hypothetical protein